MDYINKEENQNAKETESPLRLVFGDATLGVCGNAGNFHYIFSYVTGGLESLAVMGWSGFTAHRALHFGVRLPIMTGGADFI